jgi:hypothetical protein
MGTNHFGEAYCLHLYGSSEIYLFYLMTSVAQGMDTQLTYTIIWRHVSVHWAACVRMDGRESRRHQVRTSVSETWDVIWTCDIPLLKFYLLLMFSWSREIIPWAAVVPWEIYSEKGSYLCLYLKEKPPKRTAAQNIYKNGQNRIWTFAVLVKWSLY